MVSKKHRWRRLSPDTGHFFFGYYDRIPWDAETKRHLAVHAPQCERLPVPGETAEIGYLERDTGRFVACVETRAWCHQQGSMQQWLVHIPGAFVFNDYDLTRRRLVARAFHPEDGIVAEYDRPVYALSRDGNLAVSLAFARIPRRGYSYADAPVPAERHPDLDSDGLFVIDLHTGKSKLIVSYRQIIERYPLLYELEDRYWWLNHPGFNADGSRIQFLFRHCDSDLSSGKPMETGGGGGGARRLRWSTTMFTVDANGGNLSCVLPDVYWSGKITHQIWGRTPQELLLDANWRGRGHEYVVINDKPEFSASLISGGMGPAGHLIFSPDGAWMLSDTYPQDGIQRLGLVNVATGDVEILGSFRHHQPLGTSQDVRCDLHPRWSLDGTVVSVDSIDEGPRGIYVTERGG